MEPLVSVLMTAYNRSMFIAEAIESVLKSKLNDFELIIVDDASTDHTVEIARTYERLDSRVKVYVNETNLGDYPNRNKAASYAKGKYLKYLDSDDIMYPHCLDFMSSAMNQFPEAGFGLSSISDVTGPYPICIQPKEIYLQHISGFGHFDRAPASAIIRRDVFEATGGFSNRRMISDFEYWLRLARNYKMVKFTNNLVWVRAHDGRESKSDYARHYKQLRIEVYDHALSHEECPLSEEEKKKFRKWLRNSMRKHWLRTVLDPIHPFR